MSFTARLTEKFPRGSVSSVAMALAAREEYVHSTIVIRKDLALHRPKYRPAGRVVTCRRQVLGDLAGCDDANRLVHRAARR